MFKDLQRLVLLLFVFVAIAAARPAMAGPALDQPPINYMTTTPDDPVARLQKRIDSGKTKLAKKIQKLDLALDWSVEDVDGLHPSLFFCPRQAKLASLAVPHGLPQGRADRERPSAACHGLPRRRPPCPSRPPKPARSP